MSENGMTGPTSNSGFGSSRYPYYYGPGGRLVLVDSALEAVNRGSTTIGIKTPKFALLSSHIKPTKALVDPAEKVFTIDRHVGARISFHCCCYCFPCNFFSFFVSDFFMI